MTSPKRALIVLAGIALASCHTITEEMPTPPSRRTTSAPVVPVIVVPVPVPVPVPGTPTAPDPAPAPGPNPAPPPNNPNPNPKPTAPPNNPGNTSGVVRIGAKVYFIERNGQILEGSENASSAQGGRRIHPH